MFIKATATGNTINGLNDEINRLPEAGHHGASAGQAVAAGQSPRPASKPGPSPASAALPSPQGPARLRLLNTPTPRPPLLCPHLGTHSSRDNSSRAHNPWLCPPQGGHFCSPTLSGPLSPKCVTLVPDCEVLGFGVCGVSGFGCRARRGPPVYSRLAQGSAPWKWLRAGISPMLTPSQDCVPNSQFQESCVFLG